MRQQVPDRDGRRVGKAIAVLEPRQVLLHRIVQLQQPRVAELQDRGGREGLGDRGDAVDGAGRGRQLARHVAVPEAPGPDQLLIVDDADGDARLVVIRHLLAHPDLVEAQRRGDVRVLGDPCYLRLPARRESGEQQRDR